MESLTVPGELDSLSKIGDFVKAAAAQAGFDRKRTYRLRLAVDEIATNIITHGYNEAGRTGDIIVGATINDEGLIIVLEDSAIPYNPLEESGPGDLDIPLDERPMGGLGVFLARENVDEFSYEYVDGHNRNIFVLKHS